MAIIFILLLILFLGIGGYHLSRTLRGIDLKNVAGALVAIVVIARFLVYTSIAYPIAVIMNVLFQNRVQTSSNWIPVPVNLQMTDANYAITSVNEAYFNNVQLSKLTGNLNFGNPDWMFALLTTIGVVVFITLTHYMLRNAQDVLKTLYDKTPFSADNSSRLKKIAVLGLAFWAMRICYNFALTTYLQHQLSVEGVELSMTTVRFIGPVFVCGLIFVLAEVFRIGFELKEENELTV